MVISQERIDSLMAQIDSIGFQKIHVLSMPGSAVSLWLEVDPRRPSLWIYHLYENHLIVGSDIKLEDAVKRYAEYTFK